MESRFERILEPELMEEEQQVLAYAQADFTQPHEMFVDLIEERFGSSLKGTFLDLGCGPCDITVRFAKRFPYPKIHAVDGSAPMLVAARKLIEKNDLAERILLIKAQVPIESGILPKRSYDGVFINSLLHHLPEQNLLWQTIERFLRPGGMIFVMDLLRPSTKKVAKEIVEKYSGNEPDILKRDFYNSLLAAFTTSEVAEHLKHTNLAHLTVEKVSDRHFIVWGKK